MEILYQDSEIIVCCKPISIESEDNNGSGMPALLRKQLNLAEDAPIFTVHRLDKQVSGVMVYAKTKGAAAALSAQMQAHQFTKEYRAVVEGFLPEDFTEKEQITAENVPCGTFSFKNRWEDLLYHDKRKNKVFVVKKERKGVKASALRFAVLANRSIAPTKSDLPKNMPNISNGSYTLLHIQLETGRTHQIRVQCASRKHPLVGDARYGSQTKGCDIALFSYRISFTHPRTKEELTFCNEAPSTYPWNLFDRK